VLQIVFQVVQLITLEEEAEVVLIVHQEDLEV
jgi:hypothetical protein